jgi:phosphocarrier protein
MSTVTITIINKLGLHARAAAKFVKLASHFASNIELVCQNRTVNGKSIMGIMMLAASRGTELVIRAEGTDADAALADLSELVANRFDEDE